MPTRPLSFEGSQGDTLSARLELPASGRPRAWALFAHCFTCSKNIRAAVQISRGPAARGIAVLRFDFTGLGESEGEFEDTNESVASMMRAFLVSIILIYVILGGLFRSFVQPLIVMFSVPFAGPNFPDDAASNGIPATLTQNTAIDFSMPPSWCSSGVM